MYAKEVYRRGTKVHVTAYNKGGQYEPKTAWTVDNKIVDGVLKYAVQFQKSGKVYWYEEGNIVLWSP